MRKLLFFLIFPGLVGCQQTRQLEKHEQEDAASESEVLILDSLLTFTAEAQLIEEFGKENVVRDTGYYPEGLDQYVMTLLYPATNKEVEITWNDTVTFSSIHSVMIDHPSTIWQTAEGITVGTPLSKLVELNKGELEFSGLGWDYGGRVSWKDGALQNRGLFVVIDASEEDYSSKAVLDSIFGDKIISSKSQTARSARLAVTQVMLIKQHE